MAWYESQTASSVLYIPGLNEARLGEASPRRARFRIASPGQAAASVPPAGPVIPLRKVSGRDFCRRVWKPPAFARSLLLRPAAGAIPHRRARFAGACGGDECPRPGWRRARSRAHRQRIFLSNDRVQVGARSGFMAGGMGVVRRARSRGGGAVDGSGGKAGWEQARAAVRAVGGRPGAVARRRARRR